LRAWQAMTHLELKAAREALGLTREHLGALVGLVGPAKTRARIVQRWETAPGAASALAVPAEVAALVDAMVQFPGLAAILDEARRRNLRD
jgi:hypothetical protein